MPENGGYVSESNEASIVNLNKIEQPVFNKQHSSRSEEG